jgi:hypothetical protein
MSDLKLDCLKNCRSYATFLFEDEESSGDDALVKGLQWQD